MRRIIGSAIAVTIVVVCAIAQGQSLSGESRQTEMASGSELAVDEQQDRLRVSWKGQVIGDFVFRDERILRPYFANLRSPDGRQVTRQHPPVTGVDAVDHDTMHPGIWLGFGDIGQQDFWRNKAAMEHVRFVVPPKVADSRLHFATECRLKSSSGEPLCLLRNDISIVPRPTGWLLTWDAEFLADRRAIVFGDQEEMGFGARVATPLTEKNGGVIRSSTGKKNAKDTWGQPAAWCDYSGGGPRSGGVMLMASPVNFRESWWHNRDYGLIVANPFGRAAMRQGTPSAVEVAQGKSLRLRFGALIHDSQSFDPAEEFAVFNKKFP